MKSNKVHFGDTEIIVISNTYFDYEEDFFEPIYIQPQLNILINRRYYPRRSFRYSSSLLYDYQPIKQKSFLHRVLDRLNDFIICK